MDRFVRDMVDGTARVRFTVSVCLLLIICTTQALDAQTLSFRTYTVTDGLAANDIEGISQDSQGNLWLGTPDGVSVFDGKTFTNYSVRDGLPGNYVTTFLPDRLVPGKMWMLAGQRVCSSVDGRFTVYTLKEGVARDLAQDRSGVIWCGTDRGIQLIKDDSVSTFPTPFPPEDVNAIAFGADETMWFQLDSSIVSYSLTTGKIRRSKLRQYGNGNIMSMEADPAGTIWVTMGGDVLLELGVDHSVQYQVMSPGLSMFAIDGRGSTAWIGKFDRIAKFDLREFPHQTLTTFRIWNSTAEHEIKSGFVDREGNVWIGYLTQGLARLLTEHRVAFPLHVQPGPTHQYAASDSNGHIWVLSDGNLHEFWRDSASGWHSYRHIFGNGDPNPPSATSDIRNAAAVAFSIDAAGRLWVARTGRRDAISSYEVHVDTHSVPAADAGRSRLQLRTTIAAPGLVHSFLVEGDKRLWVNVWGRKGMAVFDLQHRNTILRSFTDKDGYPTVYVQDLALDSRGTLWGTTFSDGLVRMAAKEVATGRFKRLSVKEGLPGRSTFTLLEIRPGTMLVGVVNHGLAIIHGDSIRTLSVLDGLPSNYIASMTVDRLGRLWLGTSIGMVCESAPGSWTFLKSQPFLQTTPAECGITRNGLLWWITADELSVYDYLAEPTSSLPPQVRIRGVRANGEQLDPAPAFVLSHERNNVEIDFVGVCLRNPEAVRYQYRLLGNDNRWNRGTNNSSITLGNLAPGEYTFEVKAVNGDGVESVAPASLMLTITAPYWKRWWFYTIASTAALLVVYFGYRRRVRTLRHEQELAEDFSRRLITSQEDERKRVARELHDDLGQELIVISNRARRVLRSSQEGRLREEFDLIIDASSRALESVRTIANNLSPHHLDEVGLAGAIKGMVDRIAGLTDVRFTLDVDPPDERIPKEFQVHLYRIVQECVNNIAKHSQASEASITFKMREHTLELAVTDNGKGADLAEVSGSARDRRGIGLAGLRERVRLLAGTVAIESTSGKGTAVTVSLPIPSPDAGRGPDGGRRR